MIMQKTLKLTIADKTTTKNIENFYNGDGQRIKQNEDGLITKYYYDDGNLLFTTDENNSKATENILDPSGVIVASKRFDGIYNNMYFFYNYDIRGSVTNILSPDGQIVKGYDYDEFGGTKEKGDYAFKNDVKFTGAVHDKSANLYYMNARFYNPNTGRFITEDTYSGNAYEPWTQHLYTYTANNPINFVDPTGHAHRSATDSGGGLEGELFEEAVNLMYESYKAKSTKNKIKVGLKKISFVWKVRKAKYVSEVVRNSDLDLPTEEKVKAVSMAFDCSVGYLVGESAGGAVKGLNSLKGISKGSIKAVKTPYGDAVQDMSKEALKLKNSINEGGYVYRAGQFGRSNTIDAQFWASENPLNPGYAQKYGVDFKNIDYIIRGKIKPGANFITRQAPGLGNNAGGALEIVTNPYDIIIDSFIMP